MTTDQRDHRGHVTHNNKTEAVGRPSQNDRLTAHTDRLTSHAGQGEETHPSLERFPDRVSIAHVSENPEDYDTRLEPIHSGLRD